MSWREITFLAALLVGVVVVVVIAAHLGSRFFAFLGSIVDRWRPTAEHQMRPGHEHLGVGVICIVGSVASLAWYNIGAMVAATLRDPEWMPILSIVVVLVLTPIVGIVSLLRWANALITFRAPLVRATDWLGRESPWQRIVNAKVTPSFRPPGQVGFEVEDGWIIADSNWVNVRSIYEEVVKAGVKADPWIEGERRKREANK